MIKSLTLARRISDIGVSEILLIAEQARARIASGHDVVVLAAGEPDFDTPDNIKAAAVRALAEGKTKYTALGGTPELKDAIIGKFERSNGLTFDRDEIIVCAGAKQVIYNAFMATLEDGDEVVVPAPYWLSYSGIVKICGAIPVIVPCDRTGFKLTPATLERAITPRTRWLMLNSPSNPTGAVYSEDELLSLAAVLRRHPHVRILSDDIYEHLIFDRLRFATLAQVAPDLAPRTLTLNGVSKAYAMTGWRLGYAGGPAELIAAMAVVQSQSTSNACSISQAAAVEALLGPQDSVAERRLTFQQRRDFIWQALRDVPGLQATKPSGAFYLFVNCAPALGRKTRAGVPIRDDGDFCRQLLEEADVAVIPGSGFGADGYFRLSFASSMAELERGAARIAQFCGDLS